MTDINQLGKVQPPTGTVNSELDRISKLYEPRPMFDKQGGFIGHSGSACLEDHRTVGAYRAWCSVCSEWCYPSNGCEVCANREEAADYVPSLVDALRAVLEHELVDCNRMYARCACGWEYGNTPAEEKFEAHRRYVITAALFGEAKQ